MYFLGQALWGTDDQTVTRAGGYTLVDLSDHLAKTLRAYLDHFALPTESFDPAVDRAGDYWWLELNPNGQWGWLEQNTGLPMAAALADLLTQGEAAR
ncbi:hypothetical protein [Streptomyces sp. NBC_01077]|uniref:hypothetical protein n=1 Tax=Streptomyces sp. NBC_01077 TaxID=2903746 RepID=UPI00386327C1